MVTPASLKRRPRAIVIGASAGAIDALGKILPMLRDPMLVPVIVVVHLSPRQPSLLPSIFQSATPLRVREPVDKEPVDGGTIWFAPSDYHLLVEKSRVFSFSTGTPVNFSRPSIDVLFASAADAFGAELCGVVLTGANEDGAEGVRAIREGGGIVVVQDPGTAEAAVMPRAAIAATEPDMIGSPSKIGEFLATFLRGRDEGEP